MYDELKHICEILENELANVNKKLDKSDGVLSGDDISYIDKLTHSIKSIKTTMAMMDSEDGYSHEGGRNMGGNYNGRYMGYSYAGRRNARRDSMGRYTRGYSRGNEEMLDQVRDLMEQAPDDQTRREFQKILDRLDK